MESLHYNVDKFYKGMKNGDKDIVENILKEIKKYDVYDIIAKLSALNLIPENQNKATIIEPIIAAILTLSKDELKWIINSLASLCWPAFCEQNGIEL